MPSSDSRAPEKQSNSSTRVEIKNLKEQLEKKADDTLVRTILGAHKEDIKEIKEIALIAKRRAGKHVCTQEDRLKEVKRTASSWSKYFRAILITIIGAGIVLGTFLARLHFTKADDDEVQAVKNTVTGIQSDVIEVKKSQVRIEKQLEPEAQLELEKKRLEMMRNMMDEYFVEADIRPVRNRRRTN